MVTRTPAIEHDGLMPFAQGGLGGELPESVSRTATFAATGRPRR
jgi:hypothetical protein